MLLCKHTMKPSYQTCLLLTFNKNLKVEYTKSSLDLGACFIALLLNPVSGELAFYSIQIIWFIPSTAHFEILSKWNEIVESGLKD